jgi:hypothetical protein
LFFNQLMITKMKKFLLYGFATLWLLIASSCGEDFLDIRPNDTLTIENFYGNQTEAVASVTAIYQALQPIYNGAAWHIGDIMSDNTDLGGGGGGDGLETLELDNFTLTSFNPIVRLIWQQCYIGIQRANIAVDRVPDVPDMSTTIRNRSLGEAHFLRGFYYYQLVRLFGDVPLYTTPTNFTEAQTIGRSPAAAVYEQIEQDLNRAFDLLPATRYTGDDRGRVNRWAAKALLADMYLTLQRTSEAAAAALAVIQSNVYTLNPDYAHNFDRMRENGPESIFEVQYRNAGQQWSDFGQGQKLNTFFAPRGQNIVPAAGYGWNVPTMDFFEQYERNSDGEIVDQRRPTSMWIPGDTFNDYVQPDQLVGSPNGFNVRKYFIPIEQVEGDAGGWSAAQNVPIIRYAEVLLIYAEAAGPAAGKPFADQVRQRAGLAPLPADLNAEQWREAIYKERRVELAFEMKRWHDLLRHPDPNYFVNVMRAHGKQNIQPFHRFLPIPQRERDINPNLTQNNGY